jgi:tRNA nucleotidyltransferase/poly(A) polymerase
MLTQPLSCPSDQSPWRDAIPIVRALAAAGHEVYLVGGCVRDLLLGRAVHDADIATNAHPEQVEACAAAAGWRTVAVGRQFGVVIVVAASGANVEVATFRHDGAYIDGRRPTTIAFTSAVDDVQRRDFTINALLYDPLRDLVIDHVGGLADLAARCLRAVGDAAARLGEDRLRVLRALRFAAHLDLAIEPATWAAVRATGLAGLAPERLVQEWAKGLAGPRRGAWLGLLADSGRLSGFCPPLAGLPPAALVATAQALDALPAAAAPDVAAATWLAAADPAPVGAWLEAQPLPRARSDAIRWLLVHHHAAAALASGALSARRRVLQHPLAAGLVQLLTACAPGAPASIALAAGLAAETAARPWRPLLRASDLIALGARPGPALGRLLRTLEDAQLEGAFADRSGAESFARARLQTDPP